MLKALLRYILFSMPCAFIKGLEFILFDKEEILATTFQVQDQHNKKLEEKNILLNYLWRCHKQVYKKDK